MSSSNQPGAIRRDQIPLGRSHGQFSGRVVAQEFEGNNITVNRIGRRSDVTQAAGDGSDAVTCNGRHGVVTLNNGANLTTAALGSETFVMSNPFVTADSCVLLSVEYDGDPATEGQPVVSIASIADGALSVMFTNVDATNALDGIVKVHYMVQGDSIPVA